MSGATAAEDLVADLALRLRDLGVTTERTASGGLTGRRTYIDARWLLGRREIAYRTSCELSAHERIVRFREAIVARDCGLAPPILWREKTWVAGWRRSGRRTVSSAGAEAAVDYVAVRRSIEAATQAAGWTFAFEGGRPL